MKKENNLNRQPTGMTTLVMGFTLIELLVVILIIGILAAVALPQYQKAVEKSRLAEGITLLRSVADAEKLFYLANNTYTTDFNDLDIGFNIHPTISSLAVASYCNLHLWRIITTKVAYAQHNSSLWYLYYDFAQDKMFCGSAQTKGLALCKSVGKGEEQTCGSNNELSCWEVNL